MCLVMQELRLMVSVVILTPKEVAVKSPLFV